MIKMCYHSGKLNIDLYACELNKIYDPRPFKWHWHINKLTTLTLSDRNNAIKRRS